jgi:uncharacterized protein
MFRHLSDLQKGLVFYGIAFALVVGLSFLPLGSEIPLIAMGVPTLTVLLMLLVVTHDGYSRAGWAELGLHRLGLRSWPLAVLAPLVVLGGSSIIVWSTGLASFAPPDLDALGWVSGVGQGFVQNAVFAMFTYSLAEEIGWRGYLLPKLARSLGDRRGMALTGALHGVFHLPVVFFTPFYHPEGNRLLISVFFIAAFTVGGLLYGYLRLSSGSVWPVSLAHSAHNYFWGLFGGMTVGSSALVSEYIAGEAGLLPIIGYGLLAIWLLRRLPSGQPRAAKPSSDREWRPKPVDDPLRDQQVGDPTEPRDGDIGLDVVHARDDENGHPYPQGHGGERQRVRANHPLAVALDLARTDAPIGDEAAHEP